MSIADNGDAIICGEVLRKDTVNILRTLASFETAVGVPDLATKIEPHHSDSHLYSVLARLLRRPELVTKEVRSIPFGSSSVNRVLWQATPAVKAFFAEHPPK